MSKKEPKELLGIMTWVPTRVCGTLLTYHCPECKKMIEYMNCTECPNCGQALIPMALPKIEYYEENK